MKSITVGAILVNMEGKIAVVKQKEGHWSLPKGHKKEEESLIETAQREVAEETGVSDLQLVKKLGVYSRPEMDENGEDMEDKQKTIHMYLYKTTQSKIAPSEKDIADAKWVSKGEVYGLLTHAKDKEFYENVMGNL